MSSYLERFAASARSPSTGIAPLVRPLYLAPARTPVPPGSSLDPGDDEALPPSPRIANEPGNSPSSHRVAPSARFEPPPPAARFEPLFPERRPPDVLGPVAPGESAGPGSTETSPSLDATDILPGRARHRSENPSSSLVPQARSVLTTPPHLDPRPRPAPMPSPAFGSNQPEGRAADEIQIHIGRVEVVALAPPQQPTAPERKRHTLRLDDYLRSGR